MSAETRLCPYCQEEIKAAAVKCKHCGSFVNEPPSTSPPAGASPVDKVSRLDVGGKIREYEVLSVLGRGGMGAVFKARHEQTGQLVAIKVIVADFTGDEHIRQRFLEEARVMAKLDHPGIVPLLTFFQEGDQLFLVMKYIEGESLEDRVERGFLPLPEALEIAEAVADALYYSHSQGQPVVHRDIKPANILLGKDGSVVVTDFGIAKALGREKMTETQGVVGTYEYMSPEQVQGSDVGPASDQYSLGATLFRTIGGVAPFPQQSASGVECMNGHLSGKVPFLKTFRDGVPDEVQWIVERSMAKRVEQRFETCAEMKSALQHARSMLGTQDAPPVRPEPPRPAVPPSTPDGTVPPTGPTTGGVAGEAIVPPAPKKKSLGVFIGVALALLVLLGIGAYSAFDGFGGGDAADEKAVADKCQPDCDGKSCGDDCCGGDCGSCADNETCEDGQCNCVPQCDGRVCGPDGCGGKCGDCQTPNVCRGGQCVCNPQCAGRSCGPDGCGGSCGACPTSHFCRGGQCQCTPDCTGKVCGSDGCSGSCGDCGGDFECIGGKCQMSADGERRRKRLAEELKDRWLDSWNDRNLNRFMNCYTSDAYQVNTWGSRTSTDMIDGRRRSLKRLWKRVSRLHVGTRGTSVVLKDQGKKAVVSFVQEYRSTTYSSDGSVVLHMRWTGTGYLIEKEAFTGIRKL